MREADPRTFSAMSATEAGESLDPPLSDLYRDYCRPELGAYLKALRLDVSYQRARGNYLYYSSDGEEVAVLDMLGGYGALILGHNHPELVELAKGLLDRDVPIHAQASVRSASALLAQRLSRYVARSSGDAHVVTFANSGAEAVEAAIKHAELEIRLEMDRILKEVDRRFTRVEKQLGRSVRLSSEDWPRALRATKASLPTVTLEEARVDIMRRNEEIFETPPSFLAVEGSFHGKTVGALQLTASSFYRMPFRRIGLRVRFLKRNDIDDFEQALVEGGLTYFDVTVDQAGRVGLLERPFLNVAACFLEPIQGEGGVRPLAKEYLGQLEERCSSRNVPLIIDEIQSGMGRTGRLLCCHKLGVRGDYYLLSKGLGGGLAKISALIISRRRYRPEFSLLHTSTFAEDDFSSAIAMRTLDILERGDWALLEECDQKGRYLLEGLRKIQECHPDVLKEVRGEGLMVGLEFQDLSHSSSNLLRQLSAQADLVYCIAGHLLHEHRIRVAATLSDRFTLRVQPPLLVTRDEIDRFLSAIERVAQILHHHDGFSLCKYVVGMASPGERAEILDCRRPRVEDTPVPGASRVAFLGHLIEARHLADYEETFRRMPEEKLDQFLRTIECRLSPALLRSVNVRSRLGSVVNFNFIGMTMTSRRVAELMRSEDLRALKKLIDEAIGIARQHGCTVIGLGQYTSIITQNCTDLLERDIAVTSGNSLTVALGVEGLVRAAAEARIPLATSTLGVVGAGGNIGSAFASTMAERVNRIVLFGSPTPGAEQKCYRTAFRVYRELIEDMRYRDPGEIEGMAAEIYATRSAQSVLRGQVGDGDIGRALFFELRKECGEDRFIRVSLDLRELRESPLVVSAANAAEPFIGPEHLCPNAVVCDMAVPLNTRREVARERSDVRVLRGGVVKLPFGEDLGLKAIPLKPGHVFACMAETMLLGLTGIDRDYSYGDLEKQRVKAIREIARVHGFELDSAGLH